MATTQLPQVVVDTNVVVAAFQSRRGASNAVLMALTAGAYQPHLSLPLVMEYRELLGRRVDALVYTPEQVGQITEAIYTLSEWHDIHYLWRPHVADPSDAMVLELAVAARAQFIVTHNVRDFPESRDFGIRAVSPVQFLRLIRG